MVWVLTFNSEQSMMVHLGLYRQMDCETDSTSQLSTVRQLMVQFNTCEQLTVGQLIIRPLIARSSHMLGLIKFLVYHMTYGIIWELKNFL